jgi:hypothetical protein
VTQRPISPNFISYKTGIDDPVAYQIDRGTYLRLVGWKQAVASLG